MTPFIPLDPVDAAWWRMDRPKNRMVIVGVLSFRDSLPIERLRTIVGSRLLRFDRFRQRLVLIDGKPYWEEDPDLNLEWHVRQVRLGGARDHAALEDLVGRVSGEALVQAKPLWDMQVCDLHDGTTNVIVRVHHCVADGMALVQVLLGMSDESEASESLATQPAAQDSLLRRSGRTAMGAARELGRMARSRTRFRYRIRRAAETLTALGKFAFLPKDSRTALRGPLGPHKRVAWSPSVELATLKRLARSMRATVNDVLLAAVAGGMRRYLEQRSGPVAPSTQIRMVIPVNLRPPRSPVSLGNLFGLALLRLPVGEQDPEIRCHIVHRRMHALKNSVEPIAAYGVLKALGGMPGKVQRWVVRSLTSACSGVMTNVPGPRTPLHFMGSTLSDVMFWVPRAGSVALGVSVLTYAGRLFVGFAADADIVPDPRNLVSSYEAELEAMIGQLLD